jgi:hypothetical protein
MFEKNILILQALPPPKRLTQVTIALTYWKGKGKVPVDAIQSYGGSGGITPLILNLGFRQKAMINFTPRPLYSLLKLPRYPLNMKLGGFRGR